MFIFDHNSSSDVSSSSSSFSLDVKLAPLELPLVAGFPNGSSLLGGGDLDLAACVGSVVFGSGRDDKGWDTAKLRSSESVSSDVARGNGEPSDTAGSSSSFELSSGVLMAASTTAIFSNPESDSDPVACCGLRLFRREASALRVGFGLRATSISAAGFQTLISSAAHKQNFRVT